MEKIQLLAPAGNFTALVAAVSNDADAIYLGSKLFNARRLAGNFNQEELKKAVQYAHLHDVKIFLTLNTLIKNNEIAPFLNQVSIAAQYGVNAVILQDLTFAPLIKKYFPLLKIHASTQATIMNSPSIQFWQKYVGVFVLAREVTKQQVREMFEKTNAHLEVFIHGHLCISYSGQCFISSLIGKRSGNRGLCASSCRKQYNGDHYLISAKDLCMIKNIPDVIESGAKTVKIEGRMKSAEYVATTTRAYRQQIDAYYERKPKSVTQETMKDLKLAFNREFTPGFFNEEKSIVDPLIPSKRGILLGKVSKGYLKVEDTLQLFDGLSTVFKGKKEGGFVRKIMTKERKEARRVMKGESVKLFVPGFKEGALVYLLSQHGGKNLLGEMKLVPISISIQVEENEHPEIIITVKQKSFSLKLNTKSTTPQKHPLRKEEMEKEVRKYQSDIFRIESIDIQTDNSFIPKSEITTFRKELDQRILDFLIPAYSEKLIIPSPTYLNTTAKEKKLHVQVYSLNDVLKAISAGAAIIYYDIFADDFVQARNYTRGKTEFFAFTPMVVSDEDCQKVKEIVFQTKPDGILINNIGLLQLNLPCRIVLGYQLNIFNDQQLQFYNYPAIASLELNAKELSSFRNKEKIIYYAHGNPVVMTFKESFNVNHLTDKKKYTFRLRKTKTGATEMLYSRTIGLLQHTPEILQAGISQLYLDLEKDVFELVQIYKKLLAGEKVAISTFKQDVTIGNLEKGVM